MFSWIIHMFETLVQFSYNTNLNNVVIIGILWQNFTIELFIGQLIYLYVLIRLIKAINYFKQTLCLLILITIMAIYLSLLQLEIFACFMFLAEFTIVIFFYTLFLHLQISTNQNTTNYVNASPIINVATFILILMLLLMSPLNNLSGTINIFYVELYNRSNYFAFNDLTFFAYSILRNNYSFHFLVGILLLFLTFFLFFTTNIYYFLNITRIDSLNNSNLKLSNNRGYYEQTAEEVQKILTNNK